MHFHAKRCWTVGTTVATLFLVSASLSGCSGGGKAVACRALSGASKSGSGLTTTHEQSTTTLPPSHDNDAGDARIPDHTPAADLDYNQRHHACS